MRISDWSSDVCSSDLCVCLHAFRRLGVQRADTGATTGPADTGLAVSDQTRRIGKTRLEQRQETQLRCRWIAARYSDQPCLPDFLAIDFRQTVDRLVQQIGRESVRERVCQYE